MAANDYQYQTDFARKYLAVGKAETLFDILEERGLPVSEEDRERILASTDAEQLRGWIRKALSATSVDQIL